MRKYFLLAILFLLGACSSIPDSPEKPQINSSTSLRFLALGDSYTIGESVNPEERWPVQLEAALEAKNILMEEPEIIAKTGWTTDELISAVEREAPQGPFDLVSLLIGVNNQFRGYSTDTYRQEFVQLLGTAISLVGNQPQRVIVLSIPDWSVTPFTRGRNQQEIASQIDLFNSIAQEETIRLGAHFIDITPISRLASDQAELIAEDGLHPSGIMYAQWVELALPITCNTLSK